MDHYKRYRSIYNCVLMLCTHQIYNFKSNSRIDPTMYLNYARSLKRQNLENVDPRTAIALDSTTPQKFDNRYYISARKRVSYF